MFEEIDSDTLMVRMAAWKTVVIDIRDQNPPPEARIREALSIPLPELPASLRGLPCATPISLVCETGCDSLLGACILWELGYRSIAILKGGFTSYSQSGLPVS